VRDECAEFREKDAPPYVVAKVEQERAAFRRAAELGVDLVAVCPTITIGPHDYRLSPSNAVIVNYLADPLKITYPGGCNIVSVSDVARGHVIAAESGKPGERYLLGSENLEWSTIHTMISEFCGAAGPLYRTNHTGSYFASTASEVLAWLSRKDPISTRVQAKMVGRYYWYSHDRMASLGFKPKPARAALAEAVSWLLASSHISRELRSTLRASREVFKARQSMELREKAEAGATL
jgi:dihydroflavonol-4-reductase